MSPDAGTVVVNSWLELGFEKGFPVVFVVHINSALNNNTMFCSDI